MEEPGSAPREEPLHAQLRHFLECVQTRRPPVVGGEQGRRALALALQIVEAMEQHNRRLFAVNSPAE